MSRRNRHKTFTADAALAAAATAMTLWYRLPMLALHAFAPNAQFRREQDRFVPEKMAALYEGALKANVEAVRIVGEALTGRLSAAEFVEAPLAIAAAGLRPAFLTVRENARRLGRRTRP
jgi:hypothetical protein